MTPTQRRTTASVISEAAPDSEPLEDILARMGKHVLSSKESNTLQSNGEESEPSRHETITVLKAETSSSDVSAFPLVDYIPAEVFLENMGFFTPSSKRIRGIYTKEKKVSERVKEDGTTEILKVEIVATHKLGLPITSDLDYYRAFLKIFYETMEQTERLRLPIAIPTKKLLRYAGKTVNKRVLREVRDWFERMAFTGIKGAVFQAKKQDYRDGFLGHLFHQVVIKGKAMKDGNMANTNYVWPAGWFLSNYIRGYVRRIDLDFHKRLRKPIAKALYPLLETGWYASDGNPYSKSYHALCQEFLLTQYEDLSRIKQQLDPAHKELKEAGFLERYEYRRAGDGDDWIIVYFPGNKFFKDQDAREDRAKLVKLIDWKEKQKQLPPPAPKGQKPTTENSPLVDEILSVCGDTKNKGAYYKAIKKYPEALIKMTLAETRQAALEGRILKNKGAFFMDTLKRLSHARA